MSTPSSDFHGDVIAQNDPSRRLARRRWMRWVGLWLVLSIPLCCLIYALVPPTYEAVSVVGLDSRRPSLFPGPPIDDDSPARFIETQMSFIMTNTVLKPVFGESADFPVIRDSTDKLQTLREGLRVWNQEGTVYMKVAFESTDPQEAAAVVNAVVRSYLVQHKDIYGGLRERELRRREDYLRGLKKEIQGREEMLIRLVTGGTVRGEVATKDDAAPAPPPVFRTATAEYYGKAAERLVQVEVDLIEAESQPGPAEARTARIETLMKVRSKLQETLAIRDSEPKTLTEGDRIKASSITREIDSLSRLYEEVHRQFENLQFALNGDTGVMLLDKAVPPGAPTNNRRIKYMVAAPAAVLTVLGGVALLGSWRRRRVESAPTAEAG